MRKLLSALAILSLTAVFLVGLLHLDPFRMLCDSMDRFFGAPPKWTQVTNLYRNPKTQEITYGDDPTDSLGKLKEYWHASSGSGRIVFVGNSQMHAINLAPGEPPATSPEKTYFDLVADDVWRTEPGELLYRLSSSGMSYPEVVWELNYMLDDPDLRPTVVLLQMNYQFFWTGGIRDSLLPMLSRASFRKRVDALAASSRPDAPAYRDALNRYGRVDEKNQQEAGDAESALQFASFTPRLTVGYEIETFARRWLNEVSSPDRRADLQESFEDFLYRGRLYLLKLEPSTARSITGSRLLAAQSAVDSIAALSAANHIRLVLFHAPVNPNVMLYRTPEDRDSYHRFVAEISKRYNLPLFDFENSIAAEHWGRLLNGPDPLHMGRIGHREMAKQVIDAMKHAEVSD